MSLALLAVVGFAAASFVGNVGAWAALVAGHALALMLASAWTAFLAGSYAGYRSIVPYSSGATDSSSHSVSRSA
jgi:hypothetical protein